MARDLFATLDLNLLKTFSVLAAEGNMRRASERLHVTQPAVSQALKRLRHHFGDELFVRTPGGLQATSYTVAMMEKIEPILDRLSTTLNQGETFDPAGINHAIRIALAPHLAEFFCANLFCAIRKTAPQAEVHLDSWNSESLRDLVKGELMLGVNVDVEESPGEIVRTSLADDYYTAYVREGHPTLGKRETVTLEDLDGVEIAALIIPDFNTRVTHIERLLKSNGYRARVGFRSSLPSAVTEVTRTTDMVYGASSFIDPQELKGLRALDVKFNNQHLNFPVTAFYHRKNRNSPQVLWLQNLVRELLLS